MFLVYQDQVIHVQQDPDQKSDSLVEVNTPAICPDNYDPNFLSTFMTAAFHRQYVRQQLALLPVEGLSWIRGL